jgi:hypothetical protein
MEPRPIPSQFFPSSVANLRPVAYYPIRPTLLLDLTPLPLPVPQVVCTQPPSLPSTSSPISPRPLTTSNASRKRLVPKKSKLGLLGAVKGNKERSQNDFSDVVRRIGGITSAGPGGYEIYVDHTEDPDLEEIVLVKKKSRTVLTLSPGVPAKRTQALLNPKPLLSRSSPRVLRTSQNSSHL